MDKFIISFSLYGDSYKYNIGALQNVRLSSKIYPGSMCYIYFRSDVDKDILKKISKIKNANLINMDKSNIYPRLWRFIPVFETKSTVIIRDTDSRLNIRESSAVCEWLKSKKDIHIMRDHEAHVNKIMAGMFGARNGILNKYKKMFYEKSHIKNKFDPITADEKIMSEIFYPIIINKAFIHDSIYKIESFSIDFPKTNYNGFVGEIINEVKPLGFLEKIFKFKSRIDSYILRNYKKIIKN